MASYLLSKEIRPKSGQYMYVSVCRDVVVGRRLLTLPKNFDTCMYMEGSEWFNACSFQHLEVQKLLVCGRSGTKNHDTVVWIG